MAPSVQLTDAGRTRPADKPVGHNGRKKSCIRHPRHHQLLADTLSDQGVVGGGICGHHSRQYGCGYHRDVANNNRACSTTLDAVVAAAGGASTVTIRGAIKGRSDVVHGVQEDNWQQATTVQEEQEAVHVARTRCQDHLVVDHPGIRSNKDGNQC